MKYLFPKRDVDYEMVMQDDDLLEFPEESLFLEDLVDDEHDGEEVEIG